MTPVYLRDLQLKQKYQKIANNYLYILRYPIFAILSFYHKIY